MQTWKTVSRRVLLDYSKFLVVEEHAVELPDGQVIPDWPWVITPDFVNVVAVTQDDEFLCFRQTKYGIEGVSLAPVGGFMEPGEDPFSAAQREFLEETGYSGEFKDLGVVEYMSAYNRAAIHCFAALNCQKITDKLVLDEGEFIEVCLLSLEKVRQMLKTGEIRNFGEGYLALDYLGLL